MLYDCHDIKWPQNVLDIFISWTQRLTKYTVNAQINACIYHSTRIIQWNLCNPTPEFSDILWHQTKIYGPKVFLLIKIKPEYSDILYNPTHLPGPWCVRLDRFWYPVQSGTFPWSLVCQIRQVLISCTIRHISLVLGQIRQVPLYIHVWMHRR